MSAPLPARAAPSILAPAGVRRRPPVRVEEGARGAATVSRVVREPHKKSRLFPAPRLRERKAGPWGSPCLWLPWMPPRGVPLCPLALPGPRLLHPLFRGSARQSIALW